MNGSIQHEAKTYPPAAACGSRFLVLGARAARVRKGGRDTADV